jgi:Zn-finger protein
MRQSLSVRRETTSITVLESRIQVRRCMRSTRWFDGFACTKCAVPLLFLEDNSRGTSIYSPAGSLIIQCTNPACGHTQDYYGRTPEKFCLLQFQE